MTAAHNAARSTAEWAKQPAPAKGFCSPDASSWRTLVLASSSGIGTHCATYRRHSPTTGSLSVRADRAEVMLRVPYLALHWSLDVGRGCPPAIAEGNASRAQSSELAGPRSIPVQPEAVNAAKCRTERLDGAATQATERRLRSLVGEVAHEIRTPLAVAGQLLDTFLRNPRINAQIASSDLVDLRAARARLTQASNWAQDILDERHLGAGNLPCVRRRFYPGQWKSSIEPLIESLATMHQVHGC